MSSVFSQSALATTAIIPRDEDLIAESRAIVVGTVEEMFAATDPQTEIVFTYVRVREEQEAGITMIDQSSGGHTEQSDLGAYKDMIARTIEQTREGFKQFDEQYYRGVPLPSEPPEAGRLQSHDAYNPMWANLIDGRCALLSADDIAGIASIYPGRAGGGSLSILTNAALPSADAESEYMSRLEANGGAGGYTWSLTNGQLPTGLRLSASGLIYGKATGAVICSFSAQVKDSSGSTANRSFTLEVRPPAPPPEVTGRPVQKEKSHRSGLQLPERQFGLHRRPRDFDYV